MEQPSSSWSSSFLVVLVVLVWLQQPESCTANKTSQHSGVRRTILSIGCGVVSGLMAAILAALLVKWMVRYVSTSPIVKGPVILSPKIEAKSLVWALSHNNQSLGSNYYRAVLENGVPLAVKRVHPFSSSPDNTTKRRIQHELELLGSLTHPNLMTLRAYVRDHLCFSLVYDHMPGGTLEDAITRLRDNDLQLTWDIRLRIAVGLIKALHFLHSHVPQILHRNLKPTNVMLDAHYEPRLSDFALANLVTPKTCPYTPPEALQNGRYTEKSEIYSFGMILGVLLTGRAPTEGFSEGSLGQWLRQLQEGGEARGALDKSIVGEEGEEDEMLMAVRVAVACLSDVPAERPSCDELVHMLTQLHSF